MLKMYILVREGTPVGHAANSAAHAALATYLKFKEDEEVVQWLDGSFRKVVCRVNDKEFEKAKTAADHVVITESNLDNQEIVIGFKPREEWPKMFKFFRLYA